MSPYNCVICHVYKQGYLKDNLINVAIGVHKGMNGITLKKSKLVFNRCFAWFDSSKGWFHELVFMQILSKGC